MGREAKGGGIKRNETASVLRGVMRKHEKEAWEKNGKQSIYPGIVRKGRTKSCWLAAETRKNRPLPSQK